jgi:hypothetical protein
MDRSQRIREFWAKHGERFAQTDRMLKERIAYHDRRYQERHPDWQPPKTSAEREAQTRARWPLPDAPAES